MEQPGIYFVMKEAVIREGDIREAIGGILEMNNPQMLQ